MKIVLRWEFNTRALTLALPLAKYLAWTCKLNDMVKQCLVPVKAIESLDGRLNHVGTICPMMRHFLNCLQKLKTWAKQQKFGIVHPQQNIKEDLAPFLDFLTVARQGISLNLLVFWELTHIY